MNLNEWQMKLRSLQAEIRNELDQTQPDLQRRSLLNSLKQQIEKAEDYLQMLQALEPPDTPAVKPSLTVYSGGKDPSRNAPF